MVEALAPRVKVEFRITDTGIGISPEQQANLFQPYSQATAGLAAGSGSSGLGLAISRMLVERMGGRIGVESDEGWGSTFWFTLPLEPAPASAVIVAPPPAAVGRDANWPGARRLLVEDNRINQQVAIGMLKRLGVTAAHGRQRPGRAGDARRNPLRLSCSWTCRCPAWTGSRPRDGCGPARPAS